MALFNSNLIGLKCVLFLFFGAIGALLPFLPQHMTYINLSVEESVLVSIVSPIIALIGPLVAAPVADRLAGGFGGATRSKTGRYLKVMLSICFILATGLYWLLLIVQPIERGPSSVQFSCNESGGVIYQTKCNSKGECHNWGSDKGWISVSNCRYYCNETVSYQFEREHSAFIPESSTAALSEYSYNFSEDDYLTPSSESESHDKNQDDTEAYEPHPHMCYKTDGETVCEVYTQYSRAVKFYVALTSSLSFTESEGDSKCRYTIADYFHCRIPNKVSKYFSNEYEGCTPSIRCDIQKPYEGESLLKQSECGYDNISFWLYLFIKSFADIYLAAAVALLATAVVIATRETSTGRGDVGKQFAAGALGFGIFAIIIGGAADGKFLEGMICFTVLMLTAVIILIFDRSLPLSPPEWWWHTRCGLLALPMSSVRKYGLEIGALALVLFTLGVFWNAIDSFLPWRIAKIEGEEWLTGLTWTIAAIPAIIFLVFAEKIVDYCGHSNLLIICFINYICHHLAIAIIEKPNLLLLCEVLEIFTLHVMYITAVLYFRHLVPRKFTACGQAVPVITHFCLGRCIGALLGGIGYKNPAKFTEVHRWFAIFAAIISTVYCACYHFYLKPKYAAPLHLPPDPAPVVIQGMNGNGSYTPLRVYHNSKSKKGHFRY